MELRQHPFMRQGPRAQTRRGLRTILASIAAIVVIGAACTSGGSPSPSASSPGTSSSGGAGSSAAPSGKPIVVGGTLGLTGAFSGPSKGYKITYDYWLDKVNASGGLLGRPVKMIIYDDESKPSNAQTLYQRLLNDDKVDLVLAPYTTAVSSAIVPLVEQHQMVLWDGGFDNEALFRKSQWIVTAYQHFEKDYGRGVFNIVQELSAAEKPTKVGVLTEQNPFSLAVRDGYEGQGGILNFAKDAGLPVAFNEAYAPTTTDFSSAIQRLKGSGADLFFALALASPASLIAKAAADGGYKPKIYCSCASEVTSLPNWADLGAAGNGVMSVTSARATDNFPGGKELLDALKAQGYADQLPNYAVVGLASLQTMQQSVEGVGSLDQANLRDFVKGHTFQTVEGPVHYGQDLIPDFAEELLQWQSDHNEVVWPSDRATGKPIIPLP